MLLAVAVITNAPRRESILLSPLEKVARGICFSSLAEAPVRGRQNLAQGGSPGNLSEIHPSPFRGDTTLPAFSASSACPERQFAVAPAGWKPFELLRSLPYPLSGTSRERPKSVVAIAHHAGKKRKATPDHGQQTMLTPPT